MSLRLAFVQQATAPDINLSAHCLQFGISRPTGYKGLARYRESGVAALNERSRRPQRSPQQTEADIARRLVALRQQHPRARSAPRRSRHEHNHHSAAP